MKQKSTPISIIIAEREEPYLERTIQSVLDSFPQDYQRPQIIIIQDGGTELRTLTPGLLDKRSDKHLLPWVKPRGCMAARDAGIMEASREYVCIIDAHQDFEKNCFLVMREAIKDHPNYCCGCGCGGLDPVTWQRSVLDPKTGERVESMRYGAIPIKFAEGKPIQHKWNRGVIDNNIAAGLMGACYFFRRDFYVNELFRPWKFGFGWGADEEILSLATYLSGGKIITADTRSWHFFRTQKELPYKLTFAGIMGQFLNAMNMWDMFQSSPNTYKKAMEMIASHPNVIRYAKELNRSREDMREEILAYRERFAQQYAYLTIDDYINDVCMTLEEYSKYIEDCKQSEKEITQDEIVSTIKKEISFVKNKEQINNSTQLYNCCKHCYSPLDESTSKHTYPNGNLLIKCKKCSQNNILIKNKR